MKIELTDEELKNLANITHTCIFDEESGLLACRKLFTMYENQSINIKYLQEELTKNGIKTLLN